jgi:SAM-dependent methyltransferase
MPGRRAFRTAYRWTEQFLDPRRAISATRALFWYWSDWRRYARMPGAERIALSDSYPQLHDRVGVTPIDAHYFYANGWAMRRVLAAPPSRHVDVGSQTMFANLLGAAVPVVFVDYRPIACAIEGVQPVGGSLLALPFRDSGLECVSCLHVAEHVGLGRYGDPLDPGGTSRAAVELARVVRPGGSLFFALPVGRPRVCFNAHRVHDPQVIRKYFSSLDLVEFSVVDDAGRYMENADILAFAAADYACGLFHFRKSA